MNPKTLGHSMPAPPTVITRHPFTDVQVRIGVMGSAAEDVTPIVADICRRLGRAIARHGCCLLTGACPGAPHEVVVAARSSGGHVVGISPAPSLKEHVDTYQSPYREYDVLIFTGLGLMGRELINIYSSDIVIIVSGRSGTLGEFAIAYEQGTLIGVLTGTGGITEALPALEASLNKKTGSEVMYEADPDVLVERLLADWLHVCMRPNLRCANAREGAMTVGIAAPEPGELRRAGHGRPRARSVCRAVPSRHRAARCRDCEREPDESLDRG